MSYEPEALEPLAPTYTLLTGSEVESAPGTHWLIKGLLPDQGIAAIFGASASGKTFLALDLALAVAGDTSWFGHRIVKNHPVVYAPLEAAGGIRNRLAAWRARGEVCSVPALFRVLAGAPVDLADARGMEALGNAVLEGVGPGAVVILDTLHRATPGSDENSSRDVGVAIEGAHQLQRIAGGLVILVHHSGKDSSKGMRGSSALFAAMDSVIEVTADASGNREWHIAKSKDGEAGAGFGFKLRSVHIGNDDDGDAVSSCVVEWNKAAVVQAARAPRGENQQAVLAAVRGELAREAGLPGGEIPYPQALALAARALAGKGLDPKRARMRAGEALAALTGAGHLRQVGSTLTPGASLIRLP